MAKAMFDDAAIAQAIAEFTAENEYRLVPAIGKNSPVTVYGENPNEYKPVVIKEEEDEPVQAISTDDIGTELGGMD